MSKHDDYVKFLASPNPLKLSFLEQKFLDDNNLQTSIGYAYMVRIYEKDGPCVWQTSSMDVQVLLEETHKYIEELRGILPSKTRSTDVKTL